MSKIRVIIDRAKWRTGAIGPNITGVGSTYLKNPDGYKCCLGFICEAVNPKLDILLVSQPGDLISPVEGLNTPAGVEIDKYWNTQLALKAMQINDDGSLSLFERELKLQELFKDSPYELEFVDKSEL
jgi:hypothetical protein